jgi:hypothetical protein
VTLTTSDDDDLRFIHSGVLQHLQQLQLTLQVRPLKKAERAQVPSESGHPERQRQVTDWCLEKLYTNYRKFMFLNSSSL